MAIIARGDADPIVQSIKDALDAYEAQHPGAEAAVHRQNNASVRVRVIARRFESMPKSRRHDDVWSFLAARALDDAMAEVSLVLAIAPAEVRASFANYEFEQPIVSQM